MKMQKGISPGIRQLEFDAPKSASKRKVESKKKTTSVRTYGLEAFGMENEGQSSLRKFFENPRDVIGHPPNPIMKMQLLKLWKEAAGAEDIGDFETFINEASDLSYDEAKKNLLRTYSTPERLHVKNARDIEEVFHAEMCESAIEECGKGDATACKVACEDCGVTDDCISVPDIRIAQKIADIAGVPVAVPQKPVQKPRKALVTKPIVITRRIPSNGIVKITRADIKAGRIVLEW